MCLASFSPSWSPLRFIAELNLSSPCSQSNCPLSFFFSCLAVARAHFDSLLSHDLVTWTDGSVPFPFGKGGSGVLANCSLCGAEAIHSFSAGPVCPCFSAEACAILQALC